MSLSTYYLKYGRHLPRLNHGRGRAYTVMRNSTSHQKIHHEKINSWVSFSFLCEYGAPLGGLSGCQSSTIILTSLFSLFFITGECCRFLHRGCAMFHVDIFFFSFFISSKLKLFCVVIISLFFLSFSLCQWFAKDTWVDICFTHGSREHLHVPTEVWEPLPRGPRSELHNFYAQSHWTGSQIDVWILKCS